MDSKLIKNLQKKIQGKVFSEKIIRDFYSVDSSSYRIIPKLVIVPRNTKDVITIVKFAALHKIPITTRGAGTGLVGGALGNGIILDMREFSKIQISPDSVIVGAGVQKGKLDSVLKKHGKFLGPNPSIGPYCAIGGMISANASGSKSLKYGGIIDNLLHVEIVLANGRKIKLPGNKLFGKKILKLANNLDKKKIPKVTKNSCGYRLDAIKNLSQTHKVIAGSEGTLGIIISAKLKIFKEPTKRTLCILGYDSVFTAAKNCISIKETQPNALEFVDHSTLKNFNHKFSKKTKCLLFVEYDDNLKLKLRKLKKYFTW